MLYFFIPIILINFLLKVIINNKERNKYDCVELIGFATVIWAIELFIVTELLSLFKCVDKIHLVFAWGIVDCCTLFVLVTFLIKKHIPLLSPFKSGIEFGKKVIKNKKVDLIPYLLFVVLGVLVLAVSIRTVPYNADSLAYHLPRIQMWEQNKTVAHFATPDYRQISSPVLAEFVNLYVYIFSGNDIFFNLVQSISYVFNSFMVYCIAKRRLLSQRGAFIATFMAMATPIALAEAFNTQVDLFTTVWMMIFAYEMLALSEKSEIKIREDAFRIIIMGLCMGLGYITKQSVCIEMAVFSIILLIVRMRKKDDFKELIYSIATVLITSLIVVAPEIVRNIFTFGAVAAPQVGKNQLIGTLSPGFLLVNFIKNLLFNLPFSFFEGSQDIVYFIVYAFAGVLHVNLNSEFISECGQPYVINSPTIYTHDMAINPLNVWLLIISTIVMIVSLLKKRRCWSGFEWAICLSYCAMLTLLRWEPYDTRYQISYLMLIPILVVATLEKVLPENSGKLFAIYGVIGFICTSSFYNVFRFHANLSTHEAGIRPAGYYAMVGQFREQQAISSFINQKKYSSIGYYYQGIENVYPLNEMCKSVKHIEYIVFDEYTQRYEDASFEPDAIIWAGEMENDKISWHGAEYYPVYEYSDYHVLQNARYNEAKTTEDYLIYEVELNTYLNKISAGNYTAFVTFNDGVLADLDEETINSFANLGIASDLNAKQDESYWFMLQNGKVCHEFISDQFIYENGSFDGKHRYEIGVTGYIHCDNYIKIDGYYYSKDQPGINIVVYDNETDQIVDWVNWNGDYSKPVYRMNII